jgi:hypothetical protein
VPSVLIRPIHGGSKRAVVGSVGKISGDQLAKLASGAGGGPGISGGLQGWQGYAGHQGDPCKGDEELK